MFRRALMAVANSRSPILGCNLAPYSCLASLLSPLNAKQRCLLEPQSQNSPSSGFLLEPRLCVAPGKGRCMFSVQHSLPKFPVPPLQQTLNTFREIIKPLYSADDLKHAEQVIHRFAQNEGPKLQSMLENKAKGTVNWLENWWQSVAYLDYRLPVPIHSSPGITVPGREFKSQEEQLRFAAQWIAGVLDYKVMVDNQTLPVEMLGGQPMCMAQFYRILSACRVPGRKKDSFVVYPPDQPNPPTHIVVIHNNKFFEVNVYDENNKPLTTEQIETQLHQVVDQSSEPGPELGILTSENRNVWGQIYDRLAKDPVNKQSFTSIHRSIFVLCLDKPIRMQDTDRSSVLANQMNHGCGSSHNSCNRWFDKTMQFVIGADGAVGCNYEHSSAEGPPIISIIDHTLEFIDKPPQRLPVSGKTPQPRPLNFNLDPAAYEEIERGKESFDSLIQDLDLQAFSFTGFGKEFIKTQKMSPDAFIQVCIQLAYRQLHNVNAPTYESGSLRRFQYGRTETIRSATSASDAFCTLALDPSASAPARAAAIKQAVLGHKDYTERAMAGKGCDRHLLGLKMTAIENGLNVPEFFMDPIYTESQHFRLSTSQVPSKHNAVLCFGPVVPDGYGICYNPMPNQINFAVSTWRSCKETDSKTMVESLHKALNNAKSWLEQAPNSKL